MRTLVVVELVPILPQDDVVRRRGGGGRRGRICSIGALQEPLHGVPGQRTDHVDAPLLRLDDALHAVAEGEGDGTARLSLHHALVEAVLEGGQRVHHLRSIAFGLCLEG